MDKLIRAKEFCKKTHYRVTFYKFYYFYLCRKRKVITDKRNDLDAKCLITRPVVFKYTYSKCKNLY